MNHGHVKPNPNGSKARCGGPAICKDCATELAQYLETPKDGNRHSSSDMMKIPHIESADCWCHPILIGDYTHDGGVKHYMHNESGKQ